ncbi:hypothetical protein [Povalibacter sp.]
MIVVVNGNDLVEQLKVTAAMVANKRRTSGLFASMVDDISPPPART